MSEASMKIESDCPLHTHSKAEPSLQTLPLWFSSFACSKPIVQHSRAVTRKGRHCRPLGESCSPRGLRGRPGNGKHRAKIRREVSVLQSPASGWQLTAVLVLNPSLGWVTYCLFSWRSQTFSEDHKHSLGTSNPFPSLTLQYRVKSTSFYWNLLHMMPCGRHGVREGEAWIPSLPAKQWVSCGRWAWRRWTRTGAPIRGTADIKVYVEGDGAGRGWCSPAKLGESLGEVNKCFPDANMQQTFCKTFLYLSQRQSLEALKGWVELIDVNHA